LSAGAGNCNDGDVLRWLRCSDWCVGWSRANRGVGDNQLVGFAIGWNIDGYGLGDASTWPKLAALAVAFTLTMTLTVVVARAAK
jgi:hypothetical protein